MAKNTNTPGARDGNTPVASTPDNADVTKVQQPGTPAAGDTSTPRTQNEATLNPPLITQAPKQDEDAGKTQETDPLLDAVKDTQPAGEGGTIAPGTDPANPEKVTVETSGSFMFLDPFTHEIVDSDGTHEITLTTNVQTAIDDGRLVKA